jgi:hypothetical protein
MNPRLRIAALAATLLSACGFGDRERICQQAATEYRKENATRTIRGCLVEFQGSELAIVRILGTEQRTEFAFEARRTGDSWTLKPVVLKPQPNLP